MKSQDTKTQILIHATRLFADVGYDKFTIRLLAKDIPLAPSVLYHYFTDKDELLRSMYEYINRDLGEKRRKLKTPETASEMLRKRIEFQIENQEQIVAVLKYYLAYRKHFKRFKDGFVPDKSSLHIEEVLHYGVKTREFTVANIEDDAKVITHAINGFLLEFYPHSPRGREKEQLIQKIHTFILRALKGGEKE